MGFGNVDVVFDAFAPYTVTLSHETEQGNLFMTATVKFNADGYTSDVVEAAFMAWLDELKASANFTVAAATRAATGVQTITPNV